MLGTPKQIDKFAFCASEMLSLVAFFTFYWRFRIFSTQQNGHLSNKLACVPTLYDKFCDLVSL